MANFTDFNYQGEPSASDFIVGYKGDGSIEQRTTVNDLLSTSLASKGVRFLGYQSVAIGNGNTANANSLAIGDANTAQGLNSLVQGDSNIASGLWSTAMGASNKVTGDVAFAQGDTNQATGEASFAQGTLNIAEGQSSQAQGFRNIASGVYSHADGYNNCTGGYVANGISYGGAHVQGGYNIVAIPLAHAQGFANKIGYYEYADWYATNPPRLGFGFTGISLSSLNVYGLNNPALSSSVRLFFFGENGINTYSAYVSSTQADYNDPFGGVTGLTIFLRNDASAVLPPDDYFGPSIMCVPLTAYDGSTGVSNIGIGAFAQGYNNFVPGNYAYAQGTSNTAAGYASHAAGNGCSTGPNAINAFAHGSSCFAYGRYSHAIGIKAYAGHDHSYVWNSDPNVTGNYFSSSVSGQYIVNAPGGIALSGAPTSVEGLIVKNGKNIIGEWSSSTPSNFYKNLSASTLFGFGNSAGYFYKANVALEYGNLGTSIHGYNNYVDGAATDVEGANNFIYADTGRASGMGNVLGLEGGSVEGVVNMVGVPYSISKILSSSNTIYLHSGVFSTSAPNTFYFRPGQLIQIDGTFYDTVQNALASKSSLRYTVVSADTVQRSITVVESVTAMPSYVDGRPFTDQRYVVGVQGRNTNSNTNVAGAHAEGVGNMVLSRAGHVEGEANVATGANAHAENFANFASTGSHAEGFENRAGYGVLYFDSYNASTNTFQLFTNNLSSFNSIDLPLTPGATLYFINAATSNSRRRNFTRCLVLSSDPALGTVTALSAVYPEDILSNGTSFITRSRQLFSATASYTHAEGSYNNARGNGSHAEGIYTTAQGSYSHAAGTNATAKQDYTYAWSSNNGAGPQNNGKNAETTRTGQYMVSAHGGIFFPGKVGIGTDSIENALTVNGTISATSITAGNIAYTNADFNNLPTYKTYQTNVAVKNANWPAVSATQLAEINYFNNQGTFASPGGFIIKGHSPDYSTSIQNLPGWGVYGLQIQNVDNMDPGTTFVNDGRGNSTHAFSFRAGNANFTAGADHNHVQWQGAPSNNTQAWQMTNGGSTSVYGFGANTYSQRFLVHTLPQYQISTTITAVSGYIDTLIANLGTDSDRLTGVRLIVDAAAGANNYNIINVGEVVGFTLNPGLVGLAAAAYETQCTQVSSNPTGTLSAFQFDFFIGNGSNWTPASRGIQAVDLKSRANGGNPGVNQITSQIGNPSTQYVGLTGSYRGMNKHCLARFTTNSILTGFKPGSPLTLWIPKSMPSSSPIGSGFITSDKIATFALGTFPSGVRSGYFDAYVINVSGGDMEFALCNLMDSYGFENRSWPISATGTAGWLLYGGTQDTVHRPTFGTTGFYFEREPWYFNGTNFLSGGMVKCVGLGNSEVYGDFSYGLGFRGAVIGKKSGTFAGDYNAVYGDNSVALGGSNLISTSGNQVVIGTFNDPNTNSLFVVGSGASDTNRKNVFEVTGDGDTKQSRFNIKSAACIAGAGSTQATATPITTDVVTVTGGGSTSGVILPATNGGHYIQIWNYAGAATTIYIYPNVGGIIKNQALATNAPYTNFTGEGTYTYMTSISTNTWIII